MRKKLYLFLYVNREAFRNIGGNLVTFLLTVITIAMSLAIFSFFIIVMTNINRAVSKWGDRINISAYLRDGVKGKRLAGVAGSIKSVPWIEEVRYISKDDALEILGRELEGYKGILKGITRNPLPASFTIRVSPGHRNESDMRKIVASLKLIGEIDDIQYGRKWVDKFSSVVRFLQLLALTTGFSLSIATLFVISNTIRLTIYSKSNDIYIQSLVGASDSYIRAPFIIEGITAGVTGGLIGLFLLYSIRLIFVASIPPAFSFLFEMPFPLRMSLPLLLGAGVVLTLIGSYVSMIRLFRSTEV